MTDSSQEEIVDAVPELNLEKEMNPEKEKRIASRSNCLRSSATGRARMMKLLGSVNTKGFRVRA